MESTDPPRLVDRVRDTIRRKHYSIRTEQAYVDWTKDLRLRAYIEMREPPQ